VLGALPMEGADSAAFAVRSEGMKKIDPKRNLYLFMISGFLLVVAGMAIRQGGVVHVVLGGAIAGGGLLVSLLDLPFIFSNT
jgi:hypothetical protein